MATQKWYWASASRLPHAEEQSTLRAQLLAEQEDAESAIDYLDQNESSGLMRDDDFDSMSIRGKRPARDGDENSKSSYFLFVLALGIVGLQISWSTETSAGTPYLQSLGMSKSLLSFVWIAGPLGGVLVQPYVGMRSDNCRIRWGKRLPFMVGGALLTALSFICLAWAREIVNFFLLPLSLSADAAETCTIVFATCWVYVLDFAINGVQAAIRAFIVDNAPFHQQDDANAWAGQLSGVGNIVAYICGYVDLPHHFPWIGTTQMQVFCALAAFSVCFTVAISALHVREKDPRLEGPPAEPPGLLAFLKHTVRAAILMPVQIRRVCVAQFFNWLGWFGFLFYMTTYIGQIQLDPHFAKHHELDAKEIERLWESATRYATFSLLLFAVSSVAASIVLPFFTVPLQRLPNYPGQAFGRSRRLGACLDMLRVPGLTLRRLWFTSHLLFAAMMFSTFFVRTYNAATVLTALLGINWAVCQWVPFALISVEITKPSQGTLMQSIGKPGRASQKNSDQAGVILGIHNVAMSAPQMTATIISSVIFKICQKPRGVPYDTSVSWVLRFSGLAALAAAYYTLKIEEVRHDENVEGDHTLSHI